MGDNAYYKIESQKPTEHDELKNEKKEETTFSAEYFEEKSMEGNTTSLEDDAFSEVYDIRKGNPFPEDPNMPVERQQLTIRAILVGSFLGSMVSASNIYMGLKTGFTFGAQLFGAIFGFGILRFISKTMPTWLGGGYFGPKENCTVQTAATAAGSMASIFVSSIPAMYTLNLLGKGPEEDFWRLVTFAAVSAYYGLFFAIPLRKFYILYQKLIFPTSSACALTIRSLHSGSIAQSAVRRKILSLAITLFGSIIFRVCSAYAPAILSDLHIFWWLYSLGWKGAIHLENWGWLIEITPAFFGVGFFTGLNPSLSFFLGAVLAWGIIGPIISSNGTAPYYKALSPGHPDWRAYGSMNLKSKLNPNGFDPTTSSSPRYWLLWPGVLMMLCSSFSEIFMNGSAIYKGVKQAFISFYCKILRRESHIFKDAIPDPVPPEGQIPLWQWSSLLAFSIIFTCIVLYFQYEVGIGLSLLAILLGFIFSFIGAQSSGTTDVNPVSTCAKSSQLIFGSISSAQKMEEVSAQRLNLIAGTVASSSASQSVDMIGDLKTGHLLGAYPRSQFYAQVLGSFVSVWTSVILYMLFNKAHPCFVTQFLPNYPDNEICVFGAPAVAAWRAIVSAMTSPKLPIPSSSSYASLGLGILSAIVTIFKYSLCPQKYRSFVPNFNAIGLGFIIPQTYYATAMLIGAVVAHFWKKSKPVSYDIYAISIATGLAAGEGIGGVVEAVFQIFGLSGHKYGTKAGCPYETWCG